MKKITAIILLTVCILTAFTACGDKNTENKKNKIEIVTTIFPAYDFARNIGGERINATLLVSPGSESHSYEATLEDIAKISKCDMFIYGGGDSDIWVEEIFESNPDIKEKSFSMVGYLEALGQGIIYIDAHEEHESEEKEADEHVWTSPENAIRLVNGITEKMCDISSENEEYFNANKSAYSEKLNELDNLFTEISNNAKTKTLVFEGRFPFRYLCRDYGFEYISVIDGCSSNTEVSLADVTYLTSAVNNLENKVIFYTEFSNCSVADTICNSTGAKKLYLHSCHNLTSDESEENLGYYELMKQNAENLKEALY